MRIPVLVLTSVALAFAADPALERARDLQDRPALEKLAGSFESAAHAAPKDAEGQYRAALAFSYEAEVAIEVKDKPAAKRAAESGIAVAEQAVALEPKNGEYYRVLATLYGQVIPANPMAGIGYGKKAKEAIAKALELSPKSPAVHIAAGVGNYYLPELFGGGPALALKDFNQAIALDAHSADAYLWLGVAQRKLHNNAAARQAFAKAVELNSRRVWAKEQLAKTPAQ
jgi:tetratricopeptide (TPR) repeat protein